MSRIRKERSPGSTGGTRAETKDIAAAKKVSGLEAQFVKAAGKTAVKNEDPQLAAETTVAQTQMAAAQTDPISTSTEEVQTDFNFPFAGMNGPDIASIAAYVTRDPEVRSNLGLPSSFRDFEGVLRPAEGNTEEGGPMLKKIRDQRSRRKLHELLRRIPKPTPYDSYLINPQTDKPFAWDHKKAPAGPKLNWHKVQTAYGGA